MFPLLLCVCSVWVLIASSTCKVMMTIGYGEGFILIEFCSTLVILSCL